MELIATTSIFRCMPSILPPTYRRLLGSFAYAVDGAELSFARVRESALQYELPVPDAGWPARIRLSMFVDSWSLIDHVARARKLVARFPWQDSSSAELNDFIRDTRAATQIRNCLSQLDDDVQEGQAILGILSWVDARNPGSHNRYAISSGPGSQGEAMVETPAYGIPAGADVVQFRLQVADQEADLDALHLTLRQFTRRLQDATTNSVRQALLDAAATRGVPVAELCSSGTFDMTAAMSAEAASNVPLTTAEVAPDLYRIQEPGSTAER